MHSKADAWGNKRGDNKEKASKRGTKDSYNKKKKNHTRWYGHVQRRSKCSNLPFYVFGTSRTHVNSHIHSPSKTHMHKKT